MPLRVRLRRTNTLTSLHHRLHRSLTPRLRRTMPRPRPGRHRTTNPHHNPLQEPRMTTRRPQHTPPVLPTPHPSRRRLRLSPTHMTRPAQRPQVPQLMRPRRVNMIHLVSRPTTHHAPATVPLQHPSTQSPPPSRQLPTTTRPSRPRHDRPPQVREGPLDGGGVQGASGPELCISPCILRAVQDGRLGGGDSGPHPCSSELAPTVPRPCRPRKLTAAPWRSRWRGGDVQERPVRRWSFASGRGGLPQRQDLRSRRARRPAGAVRRCAARFNNGSY